MTDLKEMLAQHEALAAQIATLKSEQRSQAIAQVQELVATYDLSGADLGIKGATAPRAARVARAGTNGKVAAKYAEPETGKTWSGRGRKPNWMTAHILRGRKMEEFRV